MNKKELIEKLDELNGEWETLELPYSHRSYKTVEYGGSKEPKDFAEENENLQAILESIDPENDDSTFIIESGWHKQDFYTFDYDFTEVLHINRESLVEGTKPYLHIANKIKETKENNPENFIHNIKGNAELGNISDISTTYEDMTKNLIFIADRNSKLAEIALGLKEYSDDVGSAFLRVEEDLGNKLKEKALDTDIYKDGLEIKLKTEDLISKEGRDFIETFAKMKDKVYFDDVTASVLNNEYESNTEDVINMKTSEVLNKFVREYNLEPSLKRVKKEAKKALIDLCGANSQEILYTDKSKKEFIVHAVSHHSCTSDYLVGLYKVKFNDDLKWETQQIYSCRGHKEGPINVESIEKEDNHYKIKTNQGDFKA